MITNIYLWSNSVLYLIFTLWCLFKTTATAEFAGLGFINGSGRSEYLTVYVGLEAGLAVFYAITALKPEYREIGIIFSLALYIGIVLVRTITLITISNIGMGTYIIAGLEVILLLIPCLIYFNVFK
jgi:hypothetical protein